MKKTIISLLLGATMLASTMPVMATTEGIVQGDVMMTSEMMELNTFTGVVKEMAEDRVVITIDEADYAFIPAEGMILTDIKVGDTVEVKTPSVLKTKDIKEATAITKVEADGESAVPQPLANNYNSYKAVVNEVTDGAISVTIEEDMVVSFKVTEDTMIFNIDGEAIEAVKAGDKVTVISTSLLKTRDIKFATAIVINNEDAEKMVYFDKFDIVDEQLISADGNLVLNVENPAEYAGKTLLVFYSMQTMSLPAQTAPDAIVVAEAETVSISFNVGDKVLNINGEAKEVEVAPYVIGEGTTLVPLRVISEAFGAEVAWDGETKTVTIVDGETTIKVVIGSKTANVNGEDKAMEEAPELLGSGVTMVPLRFISETLTAEVGYEHDTQLITVSR